MPNIQYNAAIGNKRQNEGGYYMKKTPALITTLVLTLCMLSTAALAATPADIIGVWYLNAYVVEGISVNPHDFSRDMAFQFDEDYSAYLLINGNVDTEATWMLEGEVASMIVDGQAFLVLELEGDVLVGDENGIKMIIGREKEETPAIVIAPARTDAILEDFNGEWTAYLVESYGKTFNAELIGSGIKMMIDNGSITMIAMDEEITVTGSMVGGVLVAKSDEDPFVSLTLVCLEDGTLYTEIMERVLFYFQKAD